MQNAKPQQWKALLKKSLVTAGLFVGVLAVTMLAYFLIKPYIDFQHRGMFAQSFMVVTIAVICVFIAYLGMTKRLTLRKFLVLLLAMGLVLRLGYILYTAGVARQHDTFTPNEDGHEAYAWILFTTGKLPTSNIYQFYHPPLNAMVQALFMKFINAFTGALTEWFSLGDYFTTRFLDGKPDYMDAGRYFLFSSCQILGVLYSFITAYLGVKIVCLFDFSNKTKGLLSAFVVLFPRGIQISGMLNNDGLAYMLAIASVYFAVKWHKAPHFGWIIACAFSVGLGLMTKLSAATVCLPIAAIFIYRFVCVLLTKNKRDIWTLIAQFATFLLICAPIGLWFQVYAKLRFDQSFGFVFANLNPALSTAEYSFFERFVIAFDFSEYFGMLYCRPFDNYNLFNYVLRNAVFGEFSYWQGEGFGAAAVLLGGAFIFLLVAGEIVCFFKSLKRPKRSLNGFAQTKTRSLQEVIFVVIFTLSQVGAFVYFNLSMPYGCTMDYRYILPMSLVLALTLGMVKEGLDKHNDALSANLSRWLTITSIGFLACSAAFYCTCI